MKKDKKRIQYISNTDDVTVKFSDHVHAAAIYYVLK